MIRIKCGDEMDNILYSKKPTIQDKMVRPDFYDKVNRNAGIYSVEFEVPPQLMNVIKIPLEFWVLGSCRVCY